MGVKPESRQIHVLGRDSCGLATQNESEPRRVLRVDP